MTVVLDIGDGQVVEFPDAQTAQAFMQQRTSAPEAGQGIAAGAREFFLGDDDPNTQNLGERIGTMLNTGGEALTFGLLGDEANAAIESAIPGVSYEDRRDHYRQQEEVLERDNPGLALSSELGGAALGALLPLGAAARAPTLLGRVGRGAATGGAMSGTYGFMEGEGLDDRLNDAQNFGALGMAVGGAVPVAGGGIQRAADALAGRRAVRMAARGAPTTQQLREAGRAAYQQIDDAGVQIRPDRVQDEMNAIRQYLTEQGAGYTGAERVMPAARALMDATGDVADGANTVPFRELDMFRRYAGSAAGANPANRADTRAATEVVGRLDDFVGGLTPDDVDAGDVETLTRILPRARELWSRMSRSQTIDDAIESSENYLSGGASGLRNQFARILRNPRTARSFSDAERRLMQRVAQGSIPEQMLYMASSGLGNLGTIGLGVAAGGPLGALAGAGGAFGLRKAANALAARNAEVARAVIASGGLPQLPRASDQIRRTAEALMHRGVAAGPQ